MLEPKFEQLRAQAYQIARNRGLPHAQSEDVASDTIAALLLYHSRTEETPINDELRWVSTVAFRYAVNELRRMSRGPKLCDDLEGQPDIRTTTKRVDSAHDEVIRNEVFTEMKNFGGIDRVVIENILLDKRLTDIAEMLGVTPSAVSWRKRKIIKKLKKKFGDECDGSEQ